MKSKHLTGDAVDLMAFMGRKACWELNVYDEIATAMRQSAKEYGVAIRWGGAWNVGDITQWQGSMEEAMNFYIDTCRAKNKKPFIDGPHFELGA
jgi:peptidoglycan L-alanyl-D-glutamate endopeptidase CwlK